MPTPPGSTASPTTGSASWAGSGISSSSTSSTRNAYTYLHGHSVGGTNPSLLRAIGAGAAVLAYDVDFNHEVAGDAGRISAVRPTSPGSSRPRRPTPGAPGQRGGAPGSWRATTTGTT